MSQKREEERPIYVEEVPDAEGVEGTDASQRVEEDPRGQKNRPEQPDFPPEEREQYNDPDVERAGPHE